MTNTFTGEYDYYYAALAWVAAGRQEGQSPASTDINEPPQCGFYRTRNKDKTFSPVAYWRQDGRMRCRVGARDLSDLDAADLWKWVQGNPVTHEVYQSVVAGSPWPDMDATVHEQIGRGHNNPPDDAELVKEQIDSAKAGASAYAKITDDETAARAQSLRSRLLELKGEAEKKHRTEKEPHLKAGREVDAKWLPLAKDAQVIADKIRAAMSAWENEKDRRTREAQRAAEEAARRARAAGQPPLVPPPAPPAASTPIKGAYGRAAAVKIVKVVTVTDQDAVYAHFRARPEVIEVLTKLAQRAVNDGHQVPGVTINEERKVA